MDFLQSLLRGFDVCEGFLEVMTLLLDVTAVYLGILTYQKHKHANEKLAHDPRAHIKKPSWWPCNYHALDRDRIDRASRANGRLCDVDGFKIMMAFTTIEESRCCNSKANEFAQNAEQLWPQLRDVAFLARCIPGGTPREGATRDRAECTVHASFSFMRGSIAVTMELVLRIEPGGRCSSLP